MNHEIGAPAPRPRHHHSGSRRIFTECGRGLGARAPRAPLERYRPPAAQNDEPNPSSTTPQTTAGFGKVIAAFLDRTDTVPMQQIGGAVILELQKRTDHKRTRGRLRSILESIERVPAYAKEGIGAAFDLSGASETDMPWILKTAVETCSRQCPNQGFWQDLLESHNGNRPDLEELCDAIELADAS